MAVTTATGHLPWTSAKRVSVGPGPKTERPLGLNPISLLEHQILAIITHCTIIAMEMDIVVDDMTNL
jgi:hypothetical protein